MTIFQQTALFLTATWLILVVVRFRHSIKISVGGLFMIAAYTLAAFAFGWVKLDDLGLGWPGWLPVLGFTLAALGLMLACSPLADWLASRLFKKPPTLETFGVIQQSMRKLILGIIAAWVLGGILEELIARGIVLRSIEAFLAPWLTRPAAAAIAICIAALGAGAMHIYQGPRAMLIITQLSILFGILFVVSGNNLWPVMICHGLYDTIAFIRFASRKSKYSKLER